MTRIGNATLTVPLGTDSIPIARANDTTARRALISNLSQPAYYVEAYGISPGNSSAVNTAAFTALVADMGSGGIIQFGGGTYLGNFNLSRASGYFVIKGVGILTTKLKAISGIVLDIAGTSYGKVQDLEIIAATGANVGILMGRYTESGAAGNNYAIRDVTVLSYATVAGVYNVGAEVSVLDHVIIEGHSDAPCFYISQVNKYGDSNTVYTSPNGTLSTTSMTGFHIRDCNFWKGTGITGHVFEIGPNVSQLFVSDTYLHGTIDEPIVVYDPHGQSAYCHSNKFEKIYFEANDVTAGHGSTCFKGVRSGGTGSMNLVDLEIANCQFKQGRMTTGYVDIDFSAAGFIVENPAIHQNWSVNGGGIKCLQTRGGKIVWNCTQKSLGAAITATDGTFTAAAGHDIQINDYIVVGKPKDTDADTTFTQPEKKKVTNVVGNVVTVLTAFTYDHPNSDIVFVGLPQVTTAIMTEFVSQGRPVFTHDYGCRISIAGYLTNSRTYVGGNPDYSYTIKESPVIVHGGFSNEPGNPETGMLVNCVGSGLWATTTNLDGFTQTHFPAWYSGRWFAMPLCLIASATWDPGSIAVGASAIKSVSITGANLGDFALASASVAIQALTLTAYAQDDAVIIVLANNTAASVDLASMTWRVIVFKH